MAQLGEFVPWTAETLCLCDRCDALIISGWMADQVFVKVHICKSCYQKQRRAVRQEVALPRPHSGKHTDWWSEYREPRHQKPGHRSLTKQLLAELPAGFKMPVGIEPRLQGLRNVKKAGKMEAYERMRQELVESLKRFALIGQS